MTDNLDRSNWAIVSWVFGAVIVAAAIIWKESTGGSSVPVRLT